jgi:hypothetical protein
VGAEVPCEGSAAKMEGSDEVTHGARSGRRRRREGGEGGGSSGNGHCQEEQSRDNQFCDMHLLLTPN